MSARVARAASAVAPHAVSQMHTFQIGNFAPFSEFLHIKGRHFFPLQVYL